MKMQKVKPWFHSQTCQCDAHLGISNTKTCGSWQRACAPEQALGKHHATPEGKRASQSEIHERQKLELHPRCMSFGILLPDLGL